mmetsp:Transcript_14385/g.22947  ORF Transcript_14385/g.22947 Transcript_14385/m.22947 type:complete len:871 (-) Transcript_14385:74-2686(-)
MGPRAPGDDPPFCAFQGNILPLFHDSEREWPNIVRLCLYLMGLIWTFLGIGVISDVFMTGIEKVTSSKRRIKDKRTGQWRTYYVWNATVSNLTLMALGSSAPEILLSLIEISFNDMFLGELGAGTIVGSAAFNLLCISAVCVMAIPDGEVREIKQTTVYAVTAFFSVFAYLWLVFILMVTSPNVCTVGEAIATLIFCPLFVFLAYLADRGLFDCQRGIDRYEDPKVDGQAIPDDVSDEELQMIEDDIRAKHDVELTDDQVAKIMQVQFFSKRSRAYYRHIGTQQVLRRERSDMSSIGPPDRVIQDLVFTSDDVVAEKQRQGSTENKRVEIGFAIEKYAFAENCGSAKLTLIRSGCQHVRAGVRFVTREGTAKPEEDYQHTEGCITFEKYETSKDILIKITDDVAFESAEEFYVDLSSPFCEEGSACDAALGEFPTVTVVVIDDDDQGKLRFSQEHVELSDEGQIVDLVVERYDGTRDTISCKYTTEDHSAVEELDYVACKGELVFENGDMTKTVQIVVNPARPAKRFGKKEFCLLLYEPSKNTKFDPTSDGGEDRCICTVSLDGFSKVGEGSAIWKMKENIASCNNAMGHRRWGTQFYDAIFEVGGDEEEDSEAEVTLLDYFMHFISMPWKVLFALVPPADYCGGWACFFGALVMIAVVTAIVGDLANLVGCCLGIKPEITAITFVALGTSLPDTFASKAAAAMDPYADASIGNITGSNSVNVFMGIGLSWCMGAVYWQSGQPTEKWFEKLSQLDADVQQDILEWSGCAADDTSLGKYRCERAGFIAPAGSIWFNLSVFCLNALLAIWILEMRRKRFGGELGGPKRGFLGRYFTAAFLFSQWCLYIIASSVYATVQGKSDHKDWGKFFFN